MLEEDLYRDDINSECAHEIDIQVSDGGKIILANGKPIDIRHFIFDDSNLLFSYDNEHNEQLFDICKRLFRHKLKRNERVYLTDVLDYLHIDLKQRALAIKGLYWDKEDGFEFEVVPIEYIYNYPTEKDGYILAFNVNC